MYNTILLLVIIFSATAANAATTGNREKMAVAHEKMATCLRSDRSMETCHEEMMKECKEVMGKDGCMMDHKKMHHHDQKNK